MSGLFNLSKTDRCTSSPPGLFIHLVGVRQESRTIEHLQIYNDFLSRQVRFVAGGDTVAVAVVVAHQVNDLSRVAVLLNTITFEVISA